MKKFARAALCGLLAAMGTPLSTPAHAAVDDYYAAARGKSGAQLRAALHEIISTGATALSYQAVWDALTVTDEDPANPANVLLIYSGISRSKTLNGGGRGQWNREHVWPQSRGDFGTKRGPGTDLHHLRPEDPLVNSERGNKHFDDGGSPARTAAGNRTDRDSWEPRDAVKGDVARMVLYMAVRYEGDDRWPDLEAENVTEPAQRPRLGRLSTLLQWHAEDPPDRSEKRRNEVIHERYQHNRNPFIDHPRWAASVFG